MLVGDLRTVGVILKHSKKELLLSPSIFEPASTNVGAA
jgi:hypothetical protein